MNTFFDNLCIAAFVLCFGLVAPVMAVPLFGAMF
jgi:hypothetical protein